MNSEELCRALLSQNSSGGYCKKLAKVWNINAAILIADLIYKRDYFKGRKQLTEDGFFYNTKEDILERTCLTRTGYETSLVLLEKLDIVKTTLRGVPPIKHFKLNLDLVIKILAEKQEPDTPVNQFTDLLQTEKNTEKTEISIYGPPVNQFTDLPSQLISNTKSKFTSTGLRPDKETFGSLDLKSKEGGTRKLIKRKTSNSCSSGDVKKSDLIRKALNGERLVSKPLIRVPRKHKVRVPDNVQDVVDYWSRKGLTVHGETTVSLATAVRYIKELYEGTLFNDMKSNYYHDRKFSLREIKLSIDNFVLALTSNEHMPVNKDWLKRTTLSGFFYNPRAIKHPFLQYLAKPDLVINSKAFQSIDTKPVVTNVLLDWWSKFEESRHPMTVQVKNHCVLAGKKLEAFYEENKNRFLWGTHGNQIVILAHKLTECLDKELRENDSLYSVFDSRWLISDKTFNERLPRYLISSKKMRASKGGTAPETEYEAIYTL